jgi:hypothetical protein
MLYAIDCKDFDFIDWKILGQYIAEKRLVLAVKQLWRGHYIPINDALTIIFLLNIDTTTLGVTTKDQQEEVKGILYKAQFDTNRVPKWTIENWYATYLLQSRIVGIDSIWEFIKENNIPYKDLKTDKYGHIVSDADSIELFYEMVPSYKDETIFVIVDWCYIDKLFYKMNLSDFDNYIAYNGRGTVFNGDCIVLFESGKVFCYFHEHYIFFADLKLAVC